MQRRIEENKKLIECIEQNRTQWEGMILAFKTHGQNLSVPFMIQHCQDQIDKCDAALNEEGE